MAWIVGGAVVMWLQPLPHFHWYRTIGPIIMCCLSTDLSSVPEQEINTICMVPFHSGVQWSLVSAKERDSHEQRTITHTHSTGFFNVVLFPSHWPHPPTNTNPPGLLLLTNSLLVLHVDIDPPPDEQFQDAFPLGRGWGGRSVLDGQRRNK